ncbi:MAG: NAD(+) diphosphatase, partial [Opitutae bacterium]|nr:NAD(+) diphosphatase [Opitutae bacterium]
NLDLAHFWPVLFAFAKSVNTRAGKMSAAEAKLVAEQLLACDRVLGFLEHARLPLPRQKWPRQAAELVERREEMRKARDYAKADELRLELATMGLRLEDHPAEMARRCTACGHMAYPAISPAVIVRVEKEGNILLARHVQRIPDLYTCLAGYLEVGESAEDGVRREVREETGLEVGDVVYAGSQPWPYPNQLMLAFKARWASGELALQADEIAEARWFDPADLPAIPPPGSVAYRLIHGLI